jgi:steroid delta-isomerase-like uncharacterized protein
VSTEENKALIRRFYDEVINGRNVAVLDDILAPNFEGLKVEGEDHAVNREEFKQTMAMVLKAFPDYHQIIHDWIAENDKVVTRWSIQGTQQGEYVGIPPTDKQVKGTGIDIFRTVDGKIVEHWLELDRLSITQQLGVIPPAWQASS